MLRGGDVLKGGVDKALHKKGQHLGEWMRGTSCVHQSAAEGIHELAGLPIAAPSAQVKPPCESQS